MGKIVQQIQEEISCESSMDISKVADREVDDDGRSKRTGIHPVLTHIYIIYAFNL